jgi:hypothetical protein
MKPLYRGIAVALLQCLMVLSIAGKYAIDRARLPRVWVRTINYDPNLPIRGRYLSLRLEVDVAEGEGNTAYSGYRLSIRNGRLVATPDTASSGETVVHPPQGGPAFLLDPVAYFLPEHAPDPTRRGPGEELWVEVSVPRHGTPRPIRLGVKKNGTITPLEVR